MVEPDGRLRDHWKTFASSLDGLGMTEFVHRWDEARHILRANGVTYNLHSEPSGLDRPWKLDPIPLVIGAVDSERLTKGLVQRARLLEAILQDIYGPQRLILDGHLPPEIVYANPGFLRACHNLPLMGKRFLHLAAVDLGRGPGGEIFVLGHRAQTPAGAGYTLENRIVLSRMLPEVFRDCNVQRLALFFRTFRDQLRSLAPHNRDNPRTVLLTPGPHNETYFEHAYLARYLGYTLAEGGDLTVRDNRVYLKFLDGLQPVDVILRRLEDDTCDPLELKPDSFLGVPGLVQAI
ncbi:MAG: circularly permuted type 2 ATP-grasp protein, partial [Planctomycetota bacterium]